jgi:glucosamine--fructose-6-phosphate aminotransferase (isomerizing)
MLYNYAREAISGPAPSKLYFTGCGDSYFCGLAARYASEILTGLPVEVVESLEFSRYGVRSAPSGSVVVAVSNSGEVSRTVEAVMLARAAGLRTVAVTYDKGSRLAASSEHLIAYDYRDVGFGPGTMSYMASILSLLAVAWRVAELQGRLDEAGVAAQVDRVAALAPNLTETITASDAPARELAEGLTVGTPVFVLGAGPNYGTALFFMAKMIESVRHNTVAQELEEWAHEQYFCCGPGTVTIVIAPPGASTDRAREQLQAVRDMKGVAVAVCSADDPATTQLADVVLPVVGSVDEELSPLVYLAAAELVSLYFGKSSGRVMLGFDDDWRREVNFRQIFHSRVLSSLDETPGRAK